MSALTSDNLDLRPVGTSKREQGIITPKRPKSKRQLRAAKKIAEKAALPRT